MFETATFVAILVGVVQAAKMAGMDSRYAPILAIVLGILTFGIATGVTPESLFNGVIAGLTAAGLYSGVKAQVK